MKSIGTETLCPVFGTCGGCAYHDMPYEEELARKEGDRRRLFQEKLGVLEDVFDPIVRSPEPYHYRSRLDLALRKTRDGNFAAGFQPLHRHRLIPIESCAIAREEISGFIPELTRLAVQTLPPDYRTANLVVKTGADNRVLWGGIGRRSLVMKEEDYFWAEIHGKRIFYSLDTFFQANLSILPLVMDRIRPLAAFDCRTLLLDLYAGVGLFGIYFADQAGRVVLIEESSASIKLAEFNRQIHGLHNIEIRPGKVETELALALAAARSMRPVAIVDPPRHGLSPEALCALQAASEIESLLYLSCHPESLARDLAGFLEKDWCIARLIPFDFFPRMRHLETLAYLKPARGHNS